MPKTQKDNPPQSPEKSAKGSTSEQWPAWLKKAKSTPAKHYTPEEQWEIAKKHGLLITPSMPKKPASPK